MSEHWFIPPSVRLQLLNWSDDADKWLCCNQATADLYLISPLGKLLLEQLDRTPKPIDQLYEAVCAASGESLTPELKKAVDHHLHTLGTLHLVESRA